MGSKQDDEAGDEPRERAPRGLPLQGGEEFVLSASPSPVANFYRYLYTFGLYELWRRRDTAVVTDRRLLVSRGVFNREERSISLSSIDSARYVRRGMNCYAVLTVVERMGRRTERVGPMSSRDARRFVAEVLART